MAKIPPERDEIKVVQDDFAARIHLRPDIPVSNDNDYFDLVRK